jgi:hypothetical protein
VNQALESNTPGALQRLHAGEFEPRQRNITLPLSDETVGAGTRILCCN